MQGADVSARALRLMSAALLAAVGCSHEATGPSEAGGGGEGGSAAGRGGFGGFGADACLQGTFGTSTRIDASGFAYPDGTAVTATLGLYSPQTATTTVQNGAFSIHLDWPSDACNLGASLWVPAALYVDVNGDGVCTVAEDYVFVWGSVGGPGGPGSPGVPVTGLPVSPSTQRCGGLQYAGYYDRPLDAVQRLCPEVVDCLPFCPARTPESESGALPGCQPNSDADRVDASVGGDGLDAGP